MSSSTAVPGRRLRRRVDRHPRRFRLGARSVVRTTLLVSTLAFATIEIVPVAASTRHDRSVAAIATPAPQTAQQAADLGKANAAALDVEQSIAVIDRTTGELVAVHDGDRAFNAESILKLFTAAFYLLEANGAPDAELTDQLRTMIEVSDNGIQSALWDLDIIPTIADRYGLPNTSNGPNPSDGTWGSDRITATDQARFLFLMSRDPLVGPHLMTWMASTAPTGADGFDQAFGFNVLTGEHGSKQGWSDPGWTPANLHSVGWTDRYFAAILQTSPTATYATMRASSTHTAQMIASVVEPGATGAAGATDGADAQLTGSALLAAVASWSYSNTADFGHSLAKALRTNDVVSLFGVGRLAAELVSNDDRRC